jgi:hypothetical protein
MNVTGRGSGKPLLDCLERHDLQMKFLRAQRHNGASATSGRTWKYPVAVHVSCAARSLNSAINEACSIAW